MINTDLEEDIKQLDQEIMELAEKGIDIAGLEFESDAELYDALNNLRNKLVEGLLESISLTQIKRTRQRIDEAYDEENEVSD